MRKPVKPPYTNRLIRSPYVKIGDWTYGLPAIHYRYGGPYGQTHLTIGKFCSIAENVNIFLGGGHRTDWITTYPFPRFGKNWPEAAEITDYETTNGDVWIGNDVWIGYGATILSGTKICDGAIIGAHAVVTGAVFPYAIMAGNPARAIKDRFEPEMIRKLLDLKWWDWPEEKIRANLKTLCSGKVDELR